MSRKDMINMAKANNSTDKLILMVITKHIAACRTAISFCRNIDD